MAKNRPLRPGEQPPLAGPQAKKKKSPNRPNRPNNGGGGGGSMGGGGGGGPKRPGAGTPARDTTKTGFDYSGIAADPAAWLQGEMAKSGFDPYGAGPYNAFLNQSIVQPFTEGWSAYQTNHPNGNVTIGDYIASLGWGAPAAPAPSGYPTNAFGWGKDAPGRGGKTPPPVAPDMTNFMQYVNQVIAQYSPQARGIYDSGKDRGGSRWSVYV